MGFGAGSYQFDRANERGVWHDRQRVVAARRLARVVGPISKRAAGCCARDAGSVHHARLHRGRDAGATGEPGTGAASPSVCYSVGATGRRDRAALSPHVARIRDEEAAGRGMPRILQLAHVFRTAERGCDCIHPEFAMLEWYRASAGYRDLDRRLRGAAARGRHAADDLAGAGLRSAWRVGAADRRRGLRAALPASTF